MTESATRSWRFGVANRTRFLCAEKITPFLRTCTQRSLADEPRVLLDRNELNAKVQLVYLFRDGFSLTTAAVRERTKAQMV